MILAKVRHTKLGVWVEDTLIQASGFCASNKKSFLWKRY
jgi:hypothetical protein